MTKRTFDRLLNGSAIAWPRKEISFEGCRNRRNRGNWRGNAIGYTRAGFRSPVKAIAVNIRLGSTNFTGGERRPTRRCGITARARATSFPSLIIRQN